MVFSTISEVNEGIYLHAPTQTGRKKQPSIASLTSSQSEPVCLLTV
jgi:hypothetical protein